MRKRVLIRLVALVFTLMCFTESNAQNFVVGNIITNIGDTLTVRIVVSKNKKENYRNQFTFVSVVDSSGQVVSFDHMRFAAIQ